MINNTIDTLKPYSNTELPEALERIINHNNFAHLCKYIYPDKSTTDVAEILRTIKTIDEFQQTFSIYMVNKIVELTTQGVTYDGIENIKDITNNGHLFIANHRDIVLDSALMQKVLKDNNLPTTQITVGDNLMTDQLFIDIAKINKMFTLIRGGSKIQMYKNAILHSEYIRNLITKQKESLWIAQRDGRTKNGDDKTQQGLIKMLIGSQKDIKKALLELNIIPVSISYEFESCAKAKTRETFISQHKEYKKDENEDMKSILQGAMTFKGRVHISFGKNINNILKNIPELPNNEIVDTVVKELEPDIC